ncbi:MAG: HAMP domain-containing sensor histidine kinase [Eubacteriales bacterium]|nr:HAMP domain-containing sensor histidine kinase [Eubacteriales bacterium]
MDKKVTADTRELPDIAQEFKGKQESEGPREIRVQHAGGGLKGRWTMNFMTIITAAIAIATIIVTMISASYYYSDIRNNLATRAEQSADFINRFLNSNYEQFLSAGESFVNSFEDKDKLELQIVSSSGAILTSSSAFTETGSEPGTEDVAMCLEQSATVVWMGKDTQSGERVISASAPLYGPSHNLIGCVRCISSMAIVQRQIIYVVLACLLIGLFLALVVELSNRYFIKSIVEPVMKINIIAKEIAAGRYGMRLHKVYDDEIGDLCDTINHMSEEISRAERMKNDFISSVSHELRTPLTAIGGWSDTLIAGGASDPEEVIMGLGIIQKESRRLTQMVEELLDFTRLESGRMKLNVELFDVGAELYEAVFMYETMLEKEQIQLVYDIPDQMCPVNGDRHRLKQVFLNVIDNAVKYGKSGGKIEILLSRDRYTVIIEVRDWGVGIKEDELPFVKEKFYKGSSKQRGSGIGLAVTDEIVRMHGGTLNIASKYGEGTQVTITLPMANTDTSRVEPTEIIAADTGTSEE